MLIAIVICTLVHVTTKMKLVDTVQASFTLARKVGNNFKEFWDPGLNLGSSVLLQTGWTALTKDKILNETYHDLKRMMSSQCCSLSRNMQALY